MSDNNVFWIWLGPYNYHADMLRRHIGELARTYDSEAFPPHMTLFTGEHEDDGYLKRQLAHIAKAAKASMLEIPVSGYGNSDSYWKTFYLNLKTSPQLKALNKACRTHTDANSDYVFKPHMSLLYKDLDPKLRRRLVRSADPYPDTVRFDRVFLVRPCTTDKGMDDIANWRVVEQRQIS